MFSGSGEYKPWPLDALTKGALKKFQKGGKKTTKTYREHLEERLKDPKFKKIYDERKKLSKKLVTKQEKITSTEKKRIKRFFEKLTSEPKYKKILERKEGKFVENIILIKLRDLLWQLAERRNIPQERIEEYVHRMINVVYTNIERFKRGK